MIYCFFFVLLRIGEIKWHYILLGQQRGLLFRIFGGVDKDPQRREHHVCI